MLESEAKKKICPFTMSQNSVFCEGTKCMAWKTWVKTDKGDDGDCARLLLEGKE